MEAITLFQKKPQEALAKYGHNAEVMQFFNRMAKILGMLVASSTVMAIEVILVARIR